jgi:hypothetical protein
LAEISLLEIGREGGSKKDREGGGKVGRMGRMGRMGKSMI